MYIVGWEGNTAIPVLVQLAGKEGDAALVTIEGDLFTTFADYTFEDPAIGETVCWVGKDAFRDVPSQRQCGEYSGSFSNSSLGKVNRVTGHGVPDNSGSGVFNEQGQLVGVLSRGVWNSSMMFWFDYVSVERWDGMESGIIR
jgi:hypothetical protein